MNTIFEGKHVLVIERDGWEFVERKNGKEAVAVIALTDDDELILVEQYRRPVDARVIDLPAGLVGDDAENDPARTAAKELEEETGFIAGEVRFIAKCPTSPGITSEQVSFYRALRVHGAAKPEEGIGVHLVPRARIAAWLRAESSLIDVKVWTALYFVAQST